ncbi:hypothetical protein [Brucella pituitosa]|uniref:Uncharacterized protein n=1 Tax=Brucella pituitosa TaxID=571256 RepID=A0A643EW43_9HYPH|nr:hypothetical protein [Brucella pituitosa]KAB0568798.1 hypothetical protein F7Q93_18590 [Brucella pituitosa]
MQSGFSVDHGKATEGYQQLTVMTSLRDLSCQKGSLSCSSNIMNVTHMKLVSSVVTTFTASLLGISASMAAQADVFLFLDAPTAKTSIDALSGSFQSELVDKDLTERFVTDRPRLTLSCNDKQTQILHLYIPGDLNPWPTFKGSLPTEGEVKTVNGFAPYTGYLLAASFGSGLDITMGVGDRAAGIGRAWYEGMPITLTIPSGSDLPDINISLFGADPTRHFTTELASAINVCEIFSNP